MEVGKRKGGERASHAAFGDFGSQILVNDVRMLGGGAHINQSINTIYFNPVKFSVTKS